MTAPRKSPPCGGPMWRNCGDPSPDSRRSAAASGSAPIGPLCLQKLQEITMAGKIDARLRELGITLPEAPMPQANYVPFVRSGNLVFVAGQIPLEGGKPQF